MTNRLATLARLAALAAASSPTASYGEGGGEARAAQPHEGGREGPPLNEEELRARLAAIVATTPPAASNERAQRASERGPKAPRIEMALTGRPKGAPMSVQVADIASGRILFAADADRPQNPASNVKLVTSFAALARLTPQYRFRTVLHGDTLEGDRVVGNLYLRGFGDPTLVSETLTLLAEDLQTLGVRRVTRDLVVDDGFFDGERFPSGYASIDSADPNAAYRAPTGAVSLNFNTLRVLVRPTRPGAAAHVAVDPPSEYVRLLAGVATVAAGASRVSATATALPGRLAIEVRGQIRAGAEPVELRRRVAEPALYAGHTLRAALARYGVRIDGKVRRGSAPASRGSQGPAILATRASEPLGVIVREVNKLSQNFMAEQLLKTLGAETRGAPGTTASGLEAVADELARIGVPRGAFTLQNGSGLGDASRLSAAQIVAVLRAAWHDFRIAPDFVASLALAGADGTLGHRLIGTPAERLVRAKTGTLDGVTALSGYVGGIAGAARGPLAFSVLIAGAPGGQARPIADKIAAELAAYVAGPAR